jgi:hypothetical protein
VVTLALIHNRLPDDERHRPQIQIGSAPNALA